MSDVGSDQLLAVILRPSVSIGYAGEPTQPRWRSEEADVAIRATVYLESIGHQTPILTVEEHVPTITRT